MNKPKTRNENIVVQEMEKEILIYDLKTNKAFCLNETSAMIYGLCDGERSVAEIADLMSVKLKTLVSEDFVWLALDKLKQDGLLENSGEFEIDYKGLSRRQVIKKVGLSSLIALPVISSIVAPVSAATASLAPLLALCSSPSQCQSGNCDTNRGPNVCCVPGTFGVLPGQNQCCADPPSCVLTCCAGNGTNIIVFPTCAVFGGLRVTCP